MKLIVTILFTFFVQQLFSQYYFGQDKKNASYFPCNIGSHWTYKRLNEFTDVVDTIQVSIKADTIIENVNFKIWEYDYNTHKEKLYYSNTLDTIMVLNSFFRVVQEYIIPFEIGNSYEFKDFNRYNTKYRHAGNKILDKHELMIGHTLFTCYFIRHKGMGYNDYLTEKIWFQEKTGVVKLERHCWSIGCSMNEIWKLIRCDIK